MVKPGDVCVVYQRIMRCVEIADRKARLVHVDSDGFIQVRYADPDEMIPVTDALGVRSTWPESGRLDLLEIEREERAAAAERRQRNKAKRKARRSNKLNRDAA